MKLFNKKKVSMEDVEKQVNNTLQKNTETGDQSFYRSKKLIYKLKAKAVLLNAIFLLVVMSSLLYLQDRAKPRIIYEDALSESAMKDIVTDYYSYPFTENYFNRGLQYGEGVKSVSVDDIKIFEVNTVFKSPYHYTEYDLEILLTYYYKEEQNETKEPTHQLVNRKVTLIENNNRTSFGLYNIEASIVEYGMISNETILKRIPSAKIAKEQLTAEEQQRAQNTIEVFLTQYNSDYEKAKFSFVEGYDLPIKAPNIEFKFDRFEYATKEDGNWYLVAHVIAIDENMTQKYEFKLKLNTKTNLFEKMEVNIYG